MAFERMKKVVLYGAYDRYNYGDNLMPILLEEYLRKYVSARNVDFIYTSILDSDLSRYGCKKTTSIAQVIPKLKAGDSIIVVGGEVLGASAGNLFLHVQKSHRITFLLKLIKKLCPACFDMYARRKMGAPWNYPYIPDPLDLPQGVKVIYNTVGAVPATSQKAALSRGNYVTARDQRTYDALISFREVDLVPDSVLLMSRYYTKSKLEQLVGRKVNDVVTGRDYIVVQACPYKVNFSAEKLAAVLADIKISKGVDIVLLPIGYASGHDDVLFLKKVAAAMEGAGVPVNLPYELSVWELMYIIANSSGFYGTSLHGVITAMSYSVPHYCINASIEKLVSFLQTWSVRPYSMPIDVSGLKQTIGVANPETSLALSAAVDKAQNLIERSVSVMARVLEK